MVLAITGSAIVAVSFAGTILALLAVAAICLGIGFMGALGIVIYMKRYTVVSNTLPRRAQAKALESQRVIEGRVLVPISGGVNGTSRHILQGDEIAHSLPRAIEREPVSVRDRIR